MLCSLFVVIFLVVNIYVKVTEKSSDAMCTVIDNTQCVNNHESVSKALNSEWIIPFAYALG